MMKKDKLFSIGKEGQDYQRKTSPIMKLPQFREKLRSMRATNERQEDRWDPGSSCTEPPRHSRERSRLETTKTRRNNNTDASSVDSTNAVIDEILQVIEYDSLDIDEEDESDKEFDFVVPVKLDNFDAKKRSSLSKGDKRKETMLLDNVWAMAETARRSELLWTLAADTANDFDADISSGDEESLDAGDIEEAYEKFCSLA